ncbi:MAG: hypothetical protein GC168_13780 [Candidatus Hydrogenedens sp.]|nr:hypothetical protein [Candidatus Hydrogenedens sp.]
MLWVAVLMLDVFLVGAFCERFESDVIALGQFVSPTPRMAFYAALAGIASGYLIWAGYLRYRLGMHEEARREELPGISVGLTTLRIILVASLVATLALFDLSVAGQVLVLLGGLGYIVLSLVDQYCYLRGPLRPR